jgi:hypothetical protein
MNITSVLYVAPLFIALQMGLWSQAGSGKSEGQHPELLAQALQTYANCTDGTLLRVAKTCEVLAEAVPALAQKPAPASSGVPLTQAQFEAAIAFDFEGENGKLQSNPSAPSVGYPCGVPNNYSWKFSSGGLENLPKAVEGRGRQLAGAGYNQIYNACNRPNTRKSIPNARIEFTDLVVDYYSIKQNKWVRVVKQPANGAAYAEDFVNNQATGADIRDESQGHKSVRSGIGNAASGAGASTGRKVEDGAVGYNFHGYGNRFNINWADAKAVVVSQAMRCIPNAGTDLSDCKKLGYIADVSGGRFKPVTTGWQVFTNYSGPRNFSGITAPPAPKF